MFSSGITNSSVVIAAEGSLKPSIFKPGFVSAPGRQDILAAHNAQQRRGFGVGWFDESHAGDCDTAQADRDIDPFVGQYVNGKLQLKRPQLIGDRPVEPRCAEQIFKRRLVGTGGLALRGAPESLELLVGKKNALVFGLENVLQLIVGHIHLGGRIGVGGCGGAKTAKKPRSNGDKDDN